MPTNWGSRGFGATVGAANTDMVLTTLTTAVPTQISLNVWSYLRAGATGAHVILFQGQSGAVAPYMQSYYDIANSTCVFIRYWTSGAGIWNIPIPSSGVWHSIGITYDGSLTSNKPSIYVDGVAQTVTVQNGPLGAVSTINFNFVMGNQNATTASHDGYLADVGYWSSVILTAAEISALAKGARPNTIRPTALKGYWPLDGLQSPEEDISTFKNNGTLTGTQPAFGPPYAMLSPRWPQHNAVVAAPTGQRGLGRFNMPLGI
jgi:hypothetical protein